jgi:hypothetical protein
MTNRCVPDRGMSEAGTSRRANRRDAACAAAGDLQATRRQLEEFAEGTAPSPGEAR